MSPVTFSIVVPVHDVAPYLPDCLDSLLGQSFGEALPQAACVPTKELADLKMQADWAIPTGNIGHDA